jgi:hypothetical protein
MNKYTLLIPSILKILGDEQGRLPNRVKVEATVAPCTVCMAPIRMSKSNADARLHVESKHPTSTFACCFPGQFDPTVQTEAAPVQASTDNATPAPVVPAAKPKPKAADLSFLDAALDSNPVKGKGKK